MKKISTLTSVAIILFKHTLPLVSVPEKQIIKKNVPKTAKTSVHTEEFSKMAACYGQNCHTYGRIFQAGHL